MFSGIVTLLFCGITLKHYAYYNMSRRTQLTTKYLFQVLAQLSENFIFIYLGLSLFTETSLEFKPLFIIVTVVGICVARYCAVFPLSAAINWFIRYRAKRRGKEVPDELPYSYQAMLFWAGLRGAVGVALAAGMTGPNAWALKATVLVVVVLTVIIFGGTTARMLEIMGIRTGVVEEIDSDDEFDIESHPGGSYYKSSSGNGIGHAPKRGSVALKGLNGKDHRPERGSFVSGNSSPHARPSSLSRTGSQSRKAAQREAEDLLQQATDDSGMDSDTSDLPPAVRRSPSGRTPSSGSDNDGTPYPTSGRVRADTGPQISAAGAINSLLHGTAEDQVAWFKQLDEGFIKPKLLLDSGKGPHNGGSGS
jgi:sodium/hydrogen exchanger-like protein 6/7